MNESWEPTGKKRHREEKRWGRSLLVLQLEERGLESRYIGGYIDSEWRTRWRDANISDLTINAVETAPDKS